MYQNSKIRPGSVHFLDLTEHTKPSNNTIKDRHFVVVVMSSQLTSRENHKTVVIVPVTSLYNIPWNEYRDEPALPFHHIMYKKNYPDLDHDSAVKCEQIFTINREYFNDNYIFELEKKDLQAIHQKIAGVIGFGRLTK